MPSMPIIGDFRKESVGSLNQWVLTASVSTAIFVGLGVAARLGATRRVNRAVRSQIKPKANGSATRLARAISSLGTPKVHPLLAVCLAAGERAFRGRGGSSIIAASLAATAVDKMSRVVIHQKRPRRAGKHRGLDRYAYPSGHSCAITAIATATVRELSDDSALETAGLLRVSAACVSMAMGWSRLYLDEHWIDDVAGGLCAGLAVGITAAEISRAR